MTQRDRRALRMGGALVLGLFVSLRVLPSVIRTALGAEQGLRERATLLARARDNVADAAELRDSAVRVGQALIGLAPKLVNGGRMTEAASDLSGLLSLAVARHQAKLERLEGVPDSTVAGRLRRVTVRAAFECDVRGLAGVLEALEFGKVALSLRDLRVTAVDAGSAARMPEVLRVEITVAGWYLGDGDRAGVDREADR